MTRPDSPKRYLLDFVPLSFLSLLLLLLLHYLPLPRLLLRRNVVFPL